jgi:hypothetical protein
MARSEPGIAHGETLGKGTAYSLMRDTARDRTRDLQEGKQNGKQ